MFKYPYLTLTTTEEGSVRTHGTFSHPTCLTCSWRSHSFISTNNRYISSSTKLSGITGLLDETSINHLFMPVVPRHYWKVGSQVLCLSRRFSAAIFTFKKIYDLCTHNACTTREVSFWFAKITLHHIYVWSGRYCVDKTPWPCKAVISLSRFVSLNYHFGWSDDMTTSVNTLVLKKGPWQRKLK